jgi:uncharacterized membrane protein YccC
MSDVELTAAATTLPVATTHLHILRTTVAAIAAQEIASLVGLPAPYWATMTALVVMQSTLAASWSVSWKRLLGTAIGAIVGGALAMLLPPCTLTFAVALVATGLLCAFTGLDRVSYRLTGVTLAVVMLAAGSRPASVIAIHRFAEVSIGIVVTLVITAVWPERAGVLTDDARGDRHARGPHGADVLPAGKLDLMPLRAVAKSPASAADPVSSSS